MADNNFEALRNWGCDVDGALKRVVNDEDLYKDLLAMFAEDEGFAALGNQLKAGDIQAAFDSAHTLKGVSGNLGLKPMFTTISSIVEPLRVGQTTDTEANYEKLMQQLDEFKSFIQ